MGQRPNILVLLKLLLLLVRITLRLVRVDQFNTDNWVDLVEVEHLIAFLIQEQLNEFNLRPII